MLYCFVPSFLFYGYHHAALVIGRVNVCAVVPFHRHGVVGTTKLKVLGQPLLIELLELLLEGFHAALEMNLQPLAIADRKESHTLRHVATFVDTANHVGEGLAVASTKIHFCTAHAVVVRNVAGTESELADAVVDSSLLKGCD